MPEPTPAAELRTAAGRLRYLLHPDGMPEQIRTGWTQLAYPAKQGVITVPGQEQPVLMAFWGGVSEYATAMQPTVGAALAEWLSTEADVLDELERVKPGYRLDAERFMPLVIARSINSATPMEPVL